MGRVGSYPVRSGVGRWRYEAGVATKSISSCTSSLTSATCGTLGMTSLKSARCTVVVDEEAGAKLKEKEYYRWIFENEPEWESYR